MNRKLLSTLLVVTLISMSFPAAFAGGLEYMGVDWEAVFRAHQFTQWFIVGRYGVARRGTTL